MKVANRVVTANTTDAHVVDFRVRSFNRLHDIVMTLATRFFRHRTTARRDVNVVFEPTGGEVLGMPETVFRFGGVFADESRRRVTIVADRNRTMT